MFWIRYAEQMVEGLVDRKAWLSPCCQGRGLPCLVGITPGCQPQERVTRDSW